MSHRAIEGRNILVRPVDVLDSQDGEVAVVAQVAQGDLGAGLDAELVDLGLVDIQVDGHAEEDAIGKPVVGDDAAQSQLACAGG